MDFLIGSRIDRSESPHKLDSLSPEKFGRSAYASLSYTPSKLAGNVLYKEVTSMRRVEESSSKAREWQAINHFLTDKLRHLQQEKEGNEQALSQQIAMYRRMVQEMEDTQEKRIRALQALFNEEIQKIITAKEEEAKYVQSEKQLLENRIYELQEAIAVLKEQLQTQNVSLDNAAKTVEQLEHDLAQEKQDKKHLQEKLSQETTNRQTQVAEYTKQKSSLQAEWCKRMREKEMENSSKIEQILIQNDKNIENIKNSHEKQLSKMENLHHSEAKSKEEELRGLRNTFEAESRRLAESIQSKEHMVKQLTDSLKEEREKMAEAVRKFTGDIAKLNQQKQILQQKVQISAKQAETSKEQLKRYEDNSTQTSANQQATIDRLRKEGQKMKAQIQQLGYENEDMRREIIILRKNVERTSYLLQENSIMSKQLKCMKDLLMESSLQMQRCKSQFLRLDKEKDLLLGKLRQLDMENETLYRIKYEMEQQAKIWRQTYYLNRK